jgi:sulfofructose kinase
MGDVRVIDVLGLGITTIDDLLFVDVYPPADSKVQIAGRQRHLGGLTATALVTVARLGCKAAYAGMLGHDAISQEVANGLRQQGVDLTHVAWQDDARPFEATIIVESSQHTRTIFYDASRITGPHDTLPTADVIRSARVLFLDHWGVEATIRAAKIARAANIPVVADFERDMSPRFPELLALVDHLILSQRFASKLTGESSPPAMAAGLWTPDRKIVVITCGADGAWYVSDPNQAPVHQPAFPVEVVDSTGCGDVFHGAYAACLALDMDTAERIRFAAAAAAIKATQPGGQAGIPTWAEVEAFMAQYPMSGE